ncbi:hypothetical protein DFJ58DRAFT_772388 [Suillus subalutaceus]|uniref:uncharacterized protein n=1 Tax=Suillus subalutaceus TaxID=48586 RepID=UPI001B883947|nr:uncharacterized protein DFJ58DRAFT_772388 [Suillus subalutaceus]KAG1864672.1 hypothetical protein DFJ58DRAFT_772388 [Suillus subalutaceus]
MHYTYAFRALIPNGSLRLMCAGYGITSTVYTGFLRGRGTDSDSVVMRTSSNILIVSFYSMVLCRAGK